MVLIPTTRSSNSSSQRDWEVHLMWKHNLSRLVLSCQLFTHTATVTVVGWSEEMVTTAKHKSIKPFQSDSGFVSEFESSFSLIVQPQPARSCQTLQFVHGLRWIWKPKATNYFGRRQSPSSNMGWLCSQTPKECKSWVCILVWLWKLKNWPQFKLHWE